MAARAREGHRHGCLRKLGWVSSDSEYMFGYSTLMFGHPIVDLNISSISLNTLDIV